MQIPVAGQRRVQWVTFCIWISEMNGWILMSEDWRPRTITHLTHSLSFCYNKRESYLSRLLLFFISLSGEKLPPSISLNSFLRN